MKLSPPASTVYKVLSIMIVITFLASCTTASPADIPGSEGEIVIPKHIGFVVDTEGRGVPFAMVGEVEIAADDGVISADFGQFDGQWIPAEAPGFATSYGQPLVIRDNGFFFDIILTPYHQMAGLDGRVISDGIEGEFNLALRLSTDLVEDQTVAFGLAALDRMYVVPSRISHRSAEGYRLRAAFAVQAFSGLWDQEPLAAGVTLPLTIEFTSQLGDEAVFATFDPIQGDWVEMDPGCTSLDGLIFDCQLPELNPLWAVFDLKENIVEVSSSGQTIGLAAPARQESGGSLADFNLAYDAWNIFMVDNLDNANFSFSDPALLTLLSNLKKAAKNYAKDNKTEGGKKVLMKASEAADWSGNEQMSNELFKDAGDVAEEIAEDLLKDVSCGEQKKLLNGTAQLEMLKPDSPANDQVMDKLKEITGDCDIWIGWVRLIMNTSQNHPAGLPLSGRGLGWWQEYHGVKLWTNIETHELHGESEVRHILPPVSYVSYDPCKTEIIFSGTPGNTIIAYEGKYDGTEFNILKENPYGDGIIKQVWDFHDLDENENCKLIDHKEWSFSPYYSLIVHGTTSEAPHTNLHEMLNDGDKGTSSFGETIFGNQEFQNSDPEMGVFPFLEGEIHWNFIHVKKGLPKKAK